MHLVGEFLAAQYFLKRAPIYNVLNFNILIHNKTLAVFKKVEVIVCKREKVVVR